MTSIIQDVMLEALDQNTTMIDNAIELGDGMEMCGPGLNMITFHNK